MDKEQLEQSIKEIRQAIELVMNCKGFSYGNATSVTNKLREEKRKFENMLKELLIKEL